MISRKQIENLAKYIKFLENFDQDRMLKGNNITVWATDKFIETNGEEGSYFIFGLVPLYFKNTYWIKDKRSCNCIAIKGTKIRAWELVEELFGTKCEGLDINDIDIKALKKILGQKLLEYKVNNLW